jgi:hypothetical protein
LGSTYPPPPPEGVAYVGDGDGCGNAGFCVDDVDENVVDDEDEDGFVTTQ